MLGRAGVAPSPRLELPEPPIEATPRQPADVSAIAPIGPPPRRPTPPELGPQGGPLEQRLAAAAGVEAGRARRRGVARLLLPVPGPGAAAASFERILGENLPGGAGERFQRTAGRHEEELRLAREEHPVAGFASDVGQVALELEAAGRIPGPVGRFFRRPGLGGAPQTRAGFDAQWFPIATAERPGVGSLTGRLARATGVEASKFGALEAGKATLERRPPEEIFARGVRGAAGGAAFGFGFQASSELLALGVRTTLRRMAGVGRPRVEVPVTGRTQPEAPFTPRALLPPTPEAPPAAGMPEHVVTAGAAQRMALELTGMAPARPRPQGQVVTPIGTAADDPVRLAGSELAELSLKPQKTDADVARMIELQQIVRQGAPLPAEEPPVAPAAAAAPEREIPAEPPATLFPERREARPPREIRLPEGAPEVLGGEAADVGRRAAKPGEPGTLPQPRNKKFTKHDDAALEARWYQIEDRLEAMAADAGEGVNVWKRERPDGEIITGTTVTGKAGRAMGRIKDDKRILGELEREMHARGINPREVVERYLKRADELHQSAAVAAERRAMELEAEAGGDTSFNVFEEGKPYNEAAVQEDLFGKPKLKGSLQTELLGKDAGVPTAKLKGTKLSAEEIARVKREGGEPEGERPDELPGIVREVQQFYSRVKRALASAPFEKGTGQQWLAYFERGVPGGTSREELERTGLRAMLEDKLAEPVHRQSLQFQLGRQPLKLEEVVYGKESRPELETARAAEERAYETYRAELDERGLSGSYAQDVIEWADVNQSLHQASVPKSFPARALVDDLKGLADALWAARRKVVDLEAQYGVGVEGQRETAYGEYTLPGGQNYREIIVIAPAEKALSMQDLDEHARKLAQDAGEDWDTLGPNGRQRYVQLALRRPPAGRFASPHWRDVENPIGHLRITDRTVRGEPTLFIEEIQSDLHQRGREEGYADPEKLKAAQLEVQTAETSMEEMRVAYGRALAKALEARERTATIPNPPWSPGRPTETQVAGIYIGPVLVARATLWPSGFAARALPVRLQGEPEYQERGWVIDGFVGQIQNFGTNTRDLGVALDQMRDVLKERWGTLFAAAQTLHDASELNVPGPVPELGNTAAEQGFRMTTDLATAERRLRDARDVLQKLERAVPKLPLSRTEDWAGLMVRRAIDAAVSTGKKRLAWTTGRQQAERYDMQKFVDKLVYRPENKMLVGYKDGETVATHAVTPDELPAWVGADVARRLLEAPRDELGYHELAGDFGVGGAGQNVFYDQILPKLVVDQLRRLGGGKVELEKPFMDVPILERGHELEGGPETLPPGSEQPVWSVPIPDVVVQRVKTQGLYVAEPSILSSPWLAQRANVNEADAAFGGAEQMELALERAVDQLRLQPEPEVAPKSRAARQRAAEQAEQADPSIKAVAHYRKRSDVARKIAADLAKGQATWIGRQFPNVWPEGAQPKVLPAVKGTDDYEASSRGGLMRRGQVAQVIDAGEIAQYRELIDGVGAMLQTLRSPFIETLVLFATRNDQVVASHVLTSGVLSFVTAEGEGGRDLIGHFLEEAVAAGATHVHTGHNHPSGNPTPSGIGHDISMWASFANRARKFGLTPGVNLVIDDTEYTITELKSTADGWTVTPKFIPYRYSPKVPWFTPAKGFEEGIHDPAGVASVVHRLGKAHNGYLIHLDNNGKIAGLDPFTPADLTVSGGLTAIERQVAQAMERYGAERTIIGVHAPELYGEVLRHYRESTTLQRSVLDIVGKADLGVGRYHSASEEGSIQHGVMEALQMAWVNSTVGRRVHEPGPMAVPWRAQPGYTTDASVQGSRPLVLPVGLPVDGPQMVREGLGPAYGEDGLPSTASVIAQEAIDAAEKLGITASAEGTVGKLLTAFAGTRAEQIGGALHLVLVEYERQRAEMEQLVQKDILKESLNQSAVKFLAGLPYFNEFRAVHVLAYLRDKLPKFVGKQLGVTPDRQAALFDAAEAIAEFGPDGEPVFRDVRERSGELDQVGYERLLKIYGHPAKLEAEVATLRKKLDGLRGDMNRTTIALSPSAYAVERYKLGQRAKQEAKKGAAQQILSQLKTERNVTKAELQELKASQALHAKEGILDDDAAAALPEEIAAVERRLNRLRAEISRFEGVVSGRTPAGPPIEPKDLPAKLDELKVKLDKWRELRGNAKEQDEALRTRLSNLSAFRRAYDAAASGRAVGQVRVTEAEARRRWAALSKPEQAVVRRFAQGAAAAKQQGLESHVNRELAKLEHEISTDIEAYVHHYGFEDEGAMVLWFGSALRRKKLVAGARQFRGGAEGFKRHLEGARLHGGLPLSLQKLQNEFAEALERVMFTSPDPNLVRPLGADDDVPDGFSEVLGRFGELKGQRFAVANTVYKELEFFALKPPQAPTTDALANRVWAATAKGLSKAIYYWALNQLLSIGTAARNLIGGAIQYASLVAEDLAKGDLNATQKHLLALARGLGPQNVRALPATEFGASQQTLRELDEAHGLFRAFMNLSLVPFGFVENYFKRALTLATRELEAQRIAKDMVAAGTITKDQARRVARELFYAPTFEMRASEEMVRDAFAYNYNNIPLALKKMNRTAIGKALIPFPIYGYKFARHVGRYAGAVGRLGRMKGRAGDLQKAIAAIIIFGIPAVLTWLGDEDGKAKTVDPGTGVKYDFDRSGRVYVGLNDEGLELWLRTNSYSFYGLGAVIGHTAHDRTLTEAKNYVSEFYSVGPGFQAADYFRQVRNRYQTYRNASAIAGDITRSWIPFHRPLETATRMVDPTRRKQETFDESMLYAVPLPEPVLNKFGLSRGEPRTAMGGAQLVPGYDPLLEFMKEFAGVNIKPIDPKQAQNEYRRAAIRAQARERRSGAETQRLRRLEERRRQRQTQEP